MAKLTPEIYKNLDRNFLVVDLAQAEKNAAALKQLAGKSKLAAVVKACLLYTSPSPRDRG